MQSISQDSDSQDSDEAAIKKSLKAHETIFAGVNKRMRCRNCGVTQEMEEEEKERKEEDETRTVTCHRR